MKLSKILIITVILVTIIVGCIFLLPPKENNLSQNPQDFQTRLNYALETANIEPNKIENLDFQNQTIIYIKDLKVILSTQKDPVWQIASLQEILKTAKIKSNNIQLVDLSIDHPYATLKNN